MKRVAVIGEGAWGTAISSVLTINGHHVQLWCHDAQVAEEINNSHTNTRYAWGIPLPNSITAYTDIKLALDQIDYVCISTPLTFFRTVVSTCAPHNKPHIPWLCLSKGIEHDTCMLPSQIVRGILGSNTPVAALSGPSFAREVLDAKLTAVEVAANNPIRAQEIANLFACAYFKTFINTDVLGIQLGGALKNAVCLLLGIAQGRGYADNTMALVFTRAWQDMRHVALTLGAQPETLLGLSGIGDLILTYTGQHSRNVALGRAIGKGKQWHKNMIDPEFTCEGVNTAQTIAQIAQKQNLDVPFLANLPALLNGTVCIDDLVNQLANN